MLRIREAIVVEGRYDKNTLSQVVDTLILETSGFGIFKNPEQMALLERLDHNDVDMICTMDDHVYDTNYIIADEEEIGVHFVASPAHPLSALPRVKVEQLLDQPFLLTEKGMSYRRLMDEQLARNSREINPVLETGQADLICKLVGENMGLSFLPDYVTEKMVRSGELVRLNVPELQVVVWKQLLYRREKWISSPMRAMIDHMAHIRLIG